ncbi:DUF4163 domain-containing protein [Lacinutrix iliipiscaria]|uniref:DUF4163 domain-containing protein n=1 Tax=Lacinutrix iliipiscaria TaxID=1230532 RepID=A0ABW5WLC5_9FLAO
MKLIRLLICLVLVSSCKKETRSLQFSEINILKSTATIVEINIPKAQGESQVSKTINATLNDFVCSALHLDASREKQTTLDSSIEDFNASFSNFNTLISTELEGELPVWEALIEGELIYNNENIACVAMNSSINTGAANSAMVFQFFNFNPKTGALYSTEDLVNDISGFTDLVKKYYNKEVRSSFIDAEALLNNDTFKLPKTLGFSDEGVIILYDNFEINTFEKEIIEFAIPFEVANEYLNI